MSAYWPVLIELMRDYGMGLLFAAIILQTNGVPVGANFLVMAAGAFAYAGEFDMLTLGAGVWIALLIGDITSYFLWRSLGNHLCTRYPAFQHSILPRLNQAARLFDKYGGVAVIFTRFPLSILSLAINIVTGTTNFKVNRFILAAAGGELMWAAFNLGAGYWFGDSWEDIYPLLSAAGQWLALLALLILLSYYLLRSIKRRKSKLS